MPHPRLTASDHLAFDRLLAATPEGGEVAYDLSQPKWWFLHHAVGSGLVLHGTSGELVSDTAVAPRALLAVTPEDFPFRAQTIDHGPGDTPARVVLRHAVRRARRRATVPGGGRRF
jgi:hypothetical protein